MSRPITPDFKDTTQQLNQLTIQFVASLLGIRAPHKGMMRCVLPDHDDKNPSFEIRPSANRWVCYGCNRSGGAIDLVAHVRGLSFLDAKRWLSSQTGINPGIALSQKISTPTKNPKAYSLIPPTELTPDHEVYEALIQRAPLQARGFEYLAARGISETTITKFRLSQFSNSRRIVGGLIDRFTFRRVEAAGLLTKTSSSKSWYPIFPEESIVFPFVEADQIVYLQSRKIDYTDKSLRWANLTNRQHRIFNIDALSKSACQQIAICEGVMDTLSAIEMGHCAIGMMGASAKFTMEQIRLLRTKHVELMLDWDSAGERRANELQEEFAKYGIASTRKAKPSETAKDLNEYLMENREINGRVRTSAAA